MKNGMLVGIMIVMVLLVGGFVYSNLNEITPENITGNTVATNNGANSNTPSGNVQKIVLSMKNGNYYPNTVKVKVGQPVSISLDSSIRGCYRSFTIRQLGLAKRLTTPSDTLDFTPTQKGTFRFACSMGMGTGTLIVE
ncbi:cupredoxin domain-containing protein [Candidatus Woesearchaeota archaeon]|nr:cupredoxin domain-containing protein [Candidatus Woesearchaeota archaeon]